MQKKNPFYRGTTCLRSRSGASVCQTEGPRLSVRGQSVMKLVSNFRQIIIYLLIEQPVACTGYKHFPQRWGTAFPTGVPGPSVPPLVPPLLRKWAIRATPPLLYSAGKRVPEGAHPCTRGAPRWDGSPKMEPFSLES
ncbi:hypothetical protein AVEN_107247-1 [Araneus ventricosus]|uniref:Uncharacterized protein n=1 Tax=Araneus ventricosus TaxID=182803 RepID=A0A4Y2HK41_ARAVE|nr:hypothetical protein AVEN_107247-1 [Araneus ventricosus]